MRMRFLNLYFVYIAVFFLIHLASSTTIKILNQNKLAILLMKHGRERTPAGSSADMLAGRQESNCKKPDTQNTHGERRQTAEAGR